MSNGPIGGVPGVEYPLSKDRPSLPNYCWNCGADTTAIVPSQPLVMMVPDVAGVPRPHYRYICGRCGVTIERNIPGVAEEGVWQGSSPAYGDMFKSDWATGQGQANPNSVDHAMYADNVAPPAVVKTPYVRVRAAVDSLNSAVGSNAPLRFDTVDTDTSGYTTGGGPYDRVTVPSGRAGLYIVIAQASCAGNQGNTIGMGIAVNGAILLNAANQSITGPASVTYVLMNPRMQIGYLNDNDYVQLLNTSTATGAEAFTNVFIAMTRLGI